MFRRLWRRLWRKRITLAYQPETDLLPREQYFLRGHLYRQSLLGKRDDG